MKNKKIISLISALAMIFSMFSAFTVVNAEGEKGIKLEGSLSKDLTEVTIVATAEGAEGGMTNAAVSFAVPEGVAEEDITFTADSGFDLQSDAIDNGIYTLALVAVGKFVTPKAELATIKIKFDSPLADNFKVTLGDKAGFEDTKGAISVAKGMTATALTINNPNVKPDKVDRPDENTDPDETPDKPTPVQPGASDKGIKLEASLDKTNTTLTLKATAQNAEGGMTNAAVSFAVPEGVAEEDITFTADSGFDLQSDAIDNGIYTLALVAVGKFVTPKAELATITIKFDPAVTEAVAIKLGDKAGFEDTKGAISVAKGMTATTAVAELAGSSQPKGTEVALKDYVAKEGPAAAAAAKEAGKTVYMTVDVTDKDGNPATYGTDYVAEYPAGTPLTKKQYENLIHGYNTDADMADVINNLKFVVYNKDKAAKIKTTLNAVGDDKQLVNPTETEIKYGPQRPTREPAAPAIKVSGKVDNKAKTSIAVKDVISITADVINVPDDAITGGTWTFTSSDGTKLAKVGDMTEKYDKKPQAVQSFLALASSNNKKVNVDVKFVSEDGKYTLEGTYSVTIKKAAVNNNNGGSGNGSNGDSGSGTIAHPSNANQNTTAINFKDIDTVTWAQDAILALVDKGVVNGRDNVTFDPNGTVTRAEFAKMVVLGFGLNGGAAGNFSDVDYTQWYGPYVQTAYANDVISGYDDGTFRPNGLITRQEMAAMISRAIKAANMSIASTVAPVDFTDVTDADWGKAEIAALQQAGVINGMTATTYEPQSNATRAQAAVIIYRAITKAQ